jgi:hypothetical protein
MRMLHWATKTFCFVCDSAPPAGCFSNASLLTTHWHLGWVAAVVALEHVDQAVDTAAGLGGPYFGAEEAASF